MGGGGGRSTGLYYKVVSWGRRQDKKVGWDFSKEDLESQAKRFGLDPEGLGATEVEGPWKSHPRTM